LKPRCTSVPVDIEMLLPFSPLRTQSAWRELRILLFDFSMIPACFAVNS
jgi:hypothetical protein